MAANLRLQAIEGDGWRRGLAPMLRREGRKWWRGRYGLVQLILWPVLLNGMLAFALFLLPRMATADGVAISAAEVLDTGRQMFFGLGMVALSIGVIVLLQDAIIEEKLSGTAEWILSKPLSRTAYWLAKLLPNLAGMAITLILTPGVIGYFLFARAAPGAIPAAQFWASWGMVALNLCFYATLTLMLGVLLRSRTLLLGVAIGVLFGGQVIPVGQLGLYTPWPLFQMVLLPAMGQAVPPELLTVLVSTAVWSGIFSAVAIWRMNRLAF
ncbi:MAG: ABC transporter permease [Anaerolineales bacterium]|nr:ABC transporter permease [Anaerolineales bacterium]